MFKKILFLCLGLLVLKSASAQDAEKYAVLIGEAFSFYQNKEFKLSGLKYAEAFASNGNKGYVNDRYNAACSWALANESDSAFAQLFRIAEKGSYSNLTHITTDTDLNGLHGDSRWNEVVAIVRANKERIEANYDWPLVAILDSVYTEDQKYRRQISEIEKTYGRQSPEMQAHWKLILEKDATNLALVKKILDERGWLGPDIVGDRGNSTLFLVIQHADLATQEQYLPMMRDAVSKGNAYPGSLALLEDRVALGQGKRQIYGSQIGRDMETGQFYVSPLDDPENVDKRRMEVGLGPLAEYVSRWEISWDATAYKQQLPELEAKLKR